MSDQQTDRAWAFHLPVKTLGSQSVGGNEGLSLNNRGGIATVTGGRAVRQSILLLLATRPGERVMRPDYGCWLHRLVFAPNDPGTAGLAIHYVREALERWEPRAAISQLDAGCDLNGTGDPGVLDIILEYRVRQTGWEERLALGYDLREARLMPVDAAAGRGTRSGPGGFDT